MAHCDKCNKYMECDEADVTNIGIEECENYVPNPEEFTKADDGDLVETAEVSLTVMVHCPNCGKEMDMTQDCDDFWEGKPEALIDMNNIRTEECCPYCHKTFACEFNF